ncbi:DNA-binding protein [Haliea sp. E1-2-M8]|uniref:DNA-binding protein n=1 Tax=Haliea sp. E1-2-M8 TaxID=3064706 RepID=UPI00271CAABB|nr:DNA-binding protein [Haliea sp. E1-2-M8]MDO8863249.1 DNA-binding protein [Haliea sp. E1-2-M8]
MKIKPDIKDKIAAAANALAAEGNDNPTNDQVRERMGGGSLSHISPVMREWREARKADVAAALEMPAGLKKAIETSVGQVWTAASKLASMTVDTVQREAEAAITAATSERDEALSEISRLEVCISELRQLLADRDKAVNDIQSMLDKERTHSAKLGSENAALTIRVSERDEQLKGLKAELKESKNDIKALQADLVQIARKSSEKK